jgi:hypothetical protein
VQVFRPQPARKAQREDAPLGILAGLIPSSGGDDEAESDGAQKG